MIRWLIKIIAITAGILLVLLLAVFSGIQVFVNTDTAGRMLRERINPAIAGHVSWQTQHVSILKGQVRILGLKVLDAEENTILTTRSLFADISITDLFSGRITVEAVRIQKPETFPAVDRQGRLNLIEAFAGRENSGDTIPNSNEFGMVSPELNLRINKLVLEEGSFSFQLQGSEPGKAGPRARLKDIGITIADVELADKAGKLSLTAGGGHINTYRMDIPITHISMQVVLDKGRIDPLKLEISVPDSRLAISGSVSDIFDSPLLDIKMELSAELSELRRMLGLDTELSGAINLKAAASGRPEDPEVSLSLDYNGGRLAGMEIGKAAGQIRIKDRKAVVRRMDAALAGGSIESSGTIDLQQVFPDGFTAPPADFDSVSYKFDLAAAKLRLSEIPGIPPVSGNLSGNLNLEGSGISPGTARAGVNAEIRTDDIAAAESIDPLDLRVLVRADLSGQRLGLDTLGIDGTGFNLKAAGEYDIAENAINMETSVKVADLAEFAASLGIPGVRGDAAELQATISGPVLQPLISANIRARNPGFRDAAAGGLSADLDLTAGSLKNLRGGVTAEITQVETGVQKLSGVYLKSRIDGGKIYLEPLEISLVPGQALQARGRVSPDGNYELAVTSDTIELTKLKMLEHTELTGRVKISAEGAGSINSPEMDANLRFSALTAGGKEIPDTIVNAYLRGSAVRVAVEDPFSIHTEYDLVKHDFSVTAKLPETELAPFFQLAGLQDFTGQVRGRLEAEGNTGRIKNTRAHLTVSALRLMFQGDEIAFAENLTASMENGEILMPGSRISVLKQGYIDIQGTGNLEREIDITAQGVFPAKLGESMAAGEIHSVKGELLLSAGIRGKMENPDFSAEVALRDLEMTVDRTMQRLHGVNGSIVLTKKQVGIAGISGQLENGSFNLAGNVDLENFKPAGADLEFSAESLPVQIPDVMETRINTDLKFSGTPQAASLTGAVVLVDGHYFKDVNLSLIEKAGDIGRRHRQTTPRAELPALDLPFLQNLSLDISLGHRNPLMLDNNLALLAIRPQLSISGRLESPVITGRAEITEGTIAYRNTEFEVKKGVIDFINPYRIEPEVDIRAESLVRQWTITLSVTGTPENLDFSLSSNPPEEDADILSLLAVGKTTRELAGTSTAGRSPEEMLADLLAGRLEKQVKAGTGLDIVELEYKQNGDEEQVSNEVRVTLGKELSRRLTVKYGMTTKGGEMVQQSTAVYKLMENLSAKAYQDTEGAFGGEMRYRLEFR